MIPAYLDIVTARAVGKAGTLELSLDLAAPVPTGTPQVGELSYVFDLDTDGDSKPDYTAGLSLVPGGGFRPVLRNERSGQRLEGPAFPGSANLAGAAISLTLDARALGCPRIVRVRAASHQMSGGRTAGDAAADWIVVNVGCGGTG